MFGKRENKGHVDDRATNGGRNGHASINSSPHIGFGTWLRLHGVDLITMALMGAIGLGVYEAPPAPTRSFPLYFQDGEVVYPQFAYPLRKNIIPIWAAALLAFFVPFFFISLFQIRRRSLNDYLTTNMGVLKSLITAAVFQVFIKWLIGGLRPHFYAVCKPSITQGSPPSGTGFASLMYTRSVCTGDPKQINDSLESMPSGHSTAAFAGLIFLALYLNAQLKTMSAHNSAYWKMVVTVAPILGACLIAGSLTIDEFHHWYDVLAGACIGTLCAFIGYRSVFASTFDFRFNHILLPRTTSLFHRTPFLGSSGQNGAFYDYAPRQEILSDQLPFTREGGWGWGQEASVGAPGDATSLSAFGGAGGMGGSTMRGRGTGGGALGRAEAGIADNQATHHHHNNQTAAPQI